jgi:hypothetical protein
LASTVLGRPRISGAVEKRIQAQLRAGKGILKVAREVGVGTGTVQRIARESPRPFEPRKEASLRSRSKRRFAFAALSGKCSPSRYSISSVVLVCVLRGAIRSLKFLHVVWHELRRIDGEGQLVDLAGKRERDLIIL